MLKKIVVLTFVLSCLVLGKATTSLDRNLDLSLLSIDALGSGESSSGCKWKVIDCPGLWTGDYEACLSNGDGNSCSCGSVTRECKD